MGIIKNILHTMEVKLFGWEKIEEPPKWVLKAYDRWERRLPTHPYNMTKHFKGKTFVYRVKHGMGEQGSAPIIGWYRIERLDKDVN